MGNAKVKWPSVEYAERVSIYFGHLSTGEPLFEPELEISKKVLDLMRIKPQSEGNLVRIETLIVQIDKRNHYDGSGWHDFKSCAAAWIEK